MSVVSPGTALRGVSVASLPTTGLLPPSPSAWMPRSIRPENSCFVEASAIPIASSIRCLARSRAVAGI